MQISASKNPPIQSLTGSVFVTGVMLVAAIICVRALILVFTPLQLFYDEAQYWSWGTALDFGYFSKPPLLAWIIRGFTEVCGTGEACIRLASPVLYGLTALVTGLLSARIATRFGGSSAAAFLWGTGLFATLPGVTFAARLISTDAPLLLCFALALLFLDRMRERSDIGNALGLGAAIGLGLMAKYAMIYFIMCTIVWLVLSRQGRATILRPVIIWALLPVILIITPNIRWNMANDWITFQHTGDNAKWEGLTLHFDHMAEFIGAQIGILGPVLFLVLMIGLWSMRRKRSPDVLFLLSFSVPVLLLMIVQATISRAHANWAAVAFIALCALSVAWAVSSRAKPLLLGAALLHLVIFCLLGVGDLYADLLVKEPVGSSYKRLFGWRELAKNVETLAKREGAKIVVADRRNSAAQLLYHLRDSGLAVKVWPAQDLPANHYEMAVPLTSRDQGKVLVVASCEKGNERTDIKTFEPITIVVRPRFSLTVHPFLAPGAGLLSKDIC